MAKVRVLIVDDSPTARLLLRGLLENDPEITVVGEASNGLEGVQLAEDLKPNLITMDLNMPVMNGLQAIEEIMATCAVPILMVSNQADARSAYEAVSKGALEVMVKPDIQQGEAFILKVKLLAGVPVIRHVRHYAHPYASRGRTSNPAPILSPESRVVVVAASTGGPQALAVILAQLLGDFPAPILIAQHNSSGFSAGMAQWLNTLCPLTVRLPQEGESLRCGTVYLVPSEKNLTITKNRCLTLLPQRTDEIYHPNCDALLTSAANVFGSKVIGMILTGMGNDGVRGMMAIHQAKGITMAQDESSSVVFGMNKAAIETGCIQEILSLQKIPNWLNNIVYKGVITGRITRYP
ncbi:MAG: chemotaxis-specific protein-glutamate methyltransferase CheB [Magnetococcus sp. DMHC-6]